MSKKVTKESLIKKYQEWKQNIINPDNITDWDDLGFDEAPEGFKSVDDYLEHSDDAEYDEGQQTELRIIDEFIDDLRKL
jgi:hypothetical protein